jgi:TolA-binding protein
MDSLKEMRSLLRTAGEVKMPDTYWDTYWDRLEKKLPDEPVQVTLTSRMWRAIAVPLQQPAVLGRIAVYILLLAFLMYITPDYHRDVGHRVPVEFASRFPAPVQDPSELAETKAFAEPPKLHLDRKAAKAEDGIAKARSRIADDRYSLAIPGDEAPERPLERAIERDKLEFAFKPSETAGGLAGIEEDSAYAGVRGEPAVPTAAPEVSLQAGFGKSADEEALTLSKPQGVDSPLAFAEREDSDLGSPSAGEPETRLEHEYITAENYFNKGEYVRAIPAYQNFITANEANFRDHRTLRAKYQIGEAYYQIGNYSEALSNFAAVTDAEAIETAARLAPTKVTSGEVRGAVVTELKEAEIVSELKAAKKDDDKADRRERSRARGLGRTDQQSEVLPDTLEKLISRAIFRQAQSYEHLGKRDEALTRYREYIKRYPKGEHLSKAEEKVTQMTR